MIVDSTLEEQYLHSEFLLFQHLFLSAAIDAPIAGPLELDWHGERLLSAFEYWNIAIHQGGALQAKYNELGVSYCGAE